MSRIYYSLYDRLLSHFALGKAFAKVRRAKGAPGVDGQTIADFADHVEDELSTSFTNCGPRLIGHNRCDGLRYPSPEAAREV